MREASSLSLSQRYERLKSAGRIYTEATLAGLGPDDYVALVASVTGLPHSIISASLANISHGLRHMREILQAATPAGAVWESCAPQTHAGCSLFSRRGDVVAVIAAGNGPGVHGLWPQAVAMGYRTLVKPSLREPFTAQRLVYALEQAGLAEYVALIPTGHKGAETLILQSDLAIVYGGPDVAARYGNNPRVLVQGPGRSKIVVGNDVAHEDAVALAAQSVLSLGGAACVSASTVLVEGDPDAFASSLRRELEGRTQSQSLPLGRQQEAETYERLLQFDDVPWAYDRAAAQGYPLTPHVAVVGRASDPKVQRELPFPCVTVAPFDLRKDCGVLSGSLVVTVLSRQQWLISKVLADFSIANVYIGNIPTTWMDYRVPHDGYLADFLMCNRGIRVESQWLNAAVPA
ncbi:aldehyde dehydrogenase family protein [Acidithiobacillus ferrivorans]|nr:aldehyde dehydrogenase family protein [Acidithiobacillus ferrivorans]